MTRRSNGKRIAFERLERFGGSHFNSSPALIPSSLKDIFDEAMTGATTTMASADETQTGCSALFL